ncbi:MAG: beta-glucuronidase [Planctomycetes bacterium]|nr:beta-glucuronidase [Planctomycetota bacterium]
MSTPRPEHPRPQFEREDWRNLNGTWTFTFDHGKSGVERELFTSSGFDRKIVVPFCIESELSGVAHTDFVECLWYHRRLDVPKEWEGRNTVLHFGGVDHMTELYLDGRFVGRHYGGNAPFSFDITPFIRYGESHELVLHVRDELRSNTQPAGKQCPYSKSRGCLYTRVTGIWQTVWMEAVANTGLCTCNIIPDLDSRRFVIIPTFHAVQRGQRFHVTASAGGQEVASVDASANNGIPCSLFIQSPRTWSPEDPHLYDLVLEVRESDGTVIDRVKSYGGMRKIHVEGDQVFLNNQPLYQRLVLDQGYYPDGVWTAPSDAALKRDIELAQACGFNGARLHEKVFEDRYLYWADKLGYLTWVEGPFWADGPVFLHDQGTPWLARNSLAEWREIVETSRNHPSIITWTPFNEAWHLANENEHKRLVKDAYELTSSLDPTRPVNDASGGYHVVTDVYTVHCYEQDPEKFHKMLRGTSEVPVYRPHKDRESAYAGQPYLVDEFGGIKWIPRDEVPYADNSWGYGEPPRTLREFYARLHGLVQAIRTLPNCAGFCYTQLVDVEQEQNGLFTYAREPKFDMRKIRACFLDEHLDQQEEAAKPEHASAR